MFSYCYPYGSGLHQAVTVLSTIESFSLATVILTGPTPGSKGSLYYRIYFNMFSYCYPYGSYTRQ